MGRRQTHPAQTGLPMKKKIRFYLRNMVQRVIVRILRLFPFHLRLRMAAALVRSLARFSERDIKTIEANLDLIHPDMPPDRREALKRGVWENIGRNAIELFSARDLQKQADRMQVSGPGIDILRAARAEGRPAILVTGHFGQWECIRIILRNEGMETGGIFRPHPNPYYSADFERALTPNGQPVFPRGLPGMRRIIAYLREGGFIMMLIDQYVRDSPRLDFMGHPANCATSAAELALKYDAVLMPVFGIRCEDGTYDAVFEDPIPPSDPVAMTLRFNERLAARIAEHPTQWLWNYDRWNLRHPGRNKP